MPKDTDQSEIIIFKTADENVSVNVVMRDETVWLTQDQIAEIFNVQRPAITKHLRNIFKEEELEEHSVSSILEHTANDEKTYKTKFYNLDAIIAVGYRVNSQKATQFRKWATERLKEYIIKGFAMDDERLKGAGGGHYWKELLERIRDIRSSEKVLYRQVLDLYATTSTDYDPKSEEAKQFFATVQNKLHYAVNEQTAAETIYNRADGDKAFMGLTNFSGEMPVKKDAVVAKNYLNEEELKRLNRMVSAFFDLAELRAMEHKEMRMKDWLEELGKFNEMYGKGSLRNAGSVSREKAREKAEKEYRQYQANTLSPVEKDYLATIKELEKDISEKH